MDTTWRIVELSKSAILRAFELETSGTSPALNLAAYSRTPEEGSRVKSWRTYPSTARRVPFGEITYA